MRLKVSNVCWKKFRRLKYVTETKNLCDFAHILTLPLDKQFEYAGFWQVEISVKSNTKYTLSRLNNDLINLGGATYLGMDNVSSGSHRAGTWLNHELLVSYCKQQITVESNADGKLWIFFSPPIYNAYKNGQNPFGYLQLELGSTASPYQPYGYLPLNRGKYIANKEPVQLLDKSKFSATTTQNGVTLTNNGDGTITVNGTATANVTYDLTDYFSIDMNHKYIVLESNSGTGNRQAFISSLLDDNRSRYGGYYPSNGIFKFASYNGMNPIKAICTFYAVSGEAFTNRTISNFRLFDLTTMYGAGNEPTTVAQFKADYPNELYDYNPYNAITFR